MHPAHVNSSGRQPPALGARPRVLQPLRFEQLEEALARRAVVPFAVAADDLEQRVGRRVALAGGHLRGGKLEPRLMIVGVRGEPRLERAGVGRGRREATSSAARARAISGFSLVPPAGARASLRASSVSPAAISARDQPADHLGIVGRHVADLAEDR